MIKTTSRAHLYPKTIVPLWFRLGNIILELDIQNPIAQATGIPALRSQFFKVSGHKNSSNIQGHFSLDTKIANAPFLNYVPNNNVIHGKFKK